MDGVRNVVTGNGNDIFCVEIVRLYVVVVIIMNSLFSEGNSIDYTVVRP